MFYGLGEGFARHLIRTYWVLSTPIIAGIPREKVVSLRVGWFGGILEREEERGRRVVSVMH